ncbi:MAG: hypothetical protein M3303_15775 [Gemmatimonadota bacterium]|nr:hypothetical protein [Gemmatimonadota bacterium]
MRARIGLPRLTAAIALLSFASPARAQTASSSRLPRGLAGCYTLTVSAWMLPSGHWVPDSIVPRVITLDTLPADGAWRLAPDVVDSPGARSASTPRWRVRRDTVELLWPTGRRPTRVKLWRTGAGALSGYAIAERDTAARRRPVAGTEARRIACETDPPPRFATRDTARLVDDRLIIEPLGASFRLPPVWLGVPRVTNQPFRMCSDDPDGTLEERLHTNRRMLPVVTHARGEWKREFSAVVDSVFPFDALVAQAGGGRWSLDGHCTIAVQLRIYVGNFSPEWLASRAATAGVRTARRFFQPVERAVVDTAGWQGSRLSWNAWYYDYGGQAFVDVFARRVHDHTLALVFMYVGGTKEQLAERALVLRSFEVRP